MSRPILWISHDGRYYKAACYGCSMMCEARNSNMSQAVGGLPCGSMSGIQRTVASLGAGRKEEE